MKLHFQVSGNGKPVILLHGLFGSGDNLGSLAKAISESFRVYSLDLRNHGRSPHTDRMDYPAMAEDVAEFMDDQSIPSAHLLGHSMGGKTAMQLALDEPQRVRKLVVADIAPVEYGPRHEDIMAGLTAVNTSSIQSRRQADEMLAEHVADSGVRGFLLKSLARQADGSYSLLMNLSAIEANYSKLGEANHGTPFNGDTLFIKGGESDYILPEHADAVMARFPNAQLRVLPDTGHWLHAEKPSLFNNLVLRFLKN